MVLAAEEATIRRTRRLRRTPALRSLVRETRLDPRSFILPVFIDANARAEMPIASMPGQSRWPIARAAAIASRAAEAGIGGVLLFGLPDEKDDAGRAAADPLGRGGVKGRVNTHFIQRLGNALLRSTVDIGTAIATRRISSPSVVVALPYTAQASSVVVRDGSQITPTLTVRQGTRVSVFVQHDLDFATAEAAP